MKITALKKVRFAKHGFKEIGEDFEADDHDAQIFIDMGFAEKKKRGKREKKEDENGGGEPQDPTFEENEDPSLPTSAEDDNSPSE